MIWRVIISVPLVIFSVIGLLVSPNKEPERNNENLLKCDSTICLTHDAAQTRTRMLIDEIFQGSTTDVQYLSGLESARFQMRSFFFLIFAGLLIFFLDPRKNTKCHVLFFLTIFLIFYGLDVHILNLRQRHIEQNTYRRETTLDSLRAHYQVDDRFYTIDPHRYDLIDSVNNSRRNTIQSKVCLAMKPNLEQVVCYIIPFSLLLWLPKNRKMSKNKTL